MNFQREVVDALHDQEEERKAPKWRNLYWILADFKTTAGRYLKEGTISPGTLLFDTKQAAEEWAMRPNCWVKRGVAEYLGAFEVQV